MNRETRQRIRRFAMLAGVLIVCAAANRNAAADIIYLDEGFGQRIEVTQNSAGTTQESLYLSTDGINAVSGELQFSISAGRSVAGKSGKTKKLSSSIQLLGGAAGGNIGTQFLSEGFSIDPNTDFNAVDDPLVDLNLSDNKFETISQTFNGYLPIQFSVEGTTSVLYGWVEIEASIEMANGTPDNQDFSKVIIEVKRMAFESEADVPITAGAVPEPSVIVLVLAVGVGSLACRRIFPKLEKVSSRRTEAMTP